MPRAVLATFDCSGTLIDWEGGLGCFLYGIALREGDENPPPGRELRERWEAIQFELIQGDHKPYKQILAASLRLAFGFKYDIGPAQRLGCRTAWVNRHAERAPGEERPDHEWRDLWGLADYAESP
jgi:FMN phosphatase YigB (HAD superfamily)